MTRLNFKLFDDMHSIYIYIYIYWHIRCNSSFLCLFNLQNMMFGGEGLFITTMTGPGTVWLSSLP